MDQWTFHVRRGDFAAAWAISDAALRERHGRPCWHLPRHYQYIWDGTPLDGRRVLVRCYHGLGDTIQFARYAPLIRSVARSQTFWVQPALIPLLATMQSIDTLLPLHDGAPEGEYDVDVEVMELPHVFRSTLDTLPAVVPYISVPSLDLHQLLPAAPMRVGIFWRAGDWDDRRTVPVRLTRPLAAIPGVQLCMVRRDYAAAGRPAHVVEIPHPEDIVGTARIMRGLDLVISADSMPAHLAGALGVPVWLLLHADPDWRWMDGRDDSPWYPTMRLFRQQRAGAWQEVIDRVTDALAIVCRARERIAVGGAAQ
jgi:hypothetical protein